MYYMQAQDDSPLKKTPKKLAGKRISLSFAQMLSNNVLILKCFA